MSSIVPIKSEQGDEAVSDDDFSSDSSVNAVIASYSKKEKGRKSVGDDDSSEGKYNDEAAPAKHEHHPTQKHTASATSFTETMNVQNGVKLEDDTDDTKDAPVDMEYKVCIASQAQLKGEETDDDGHIYNHQQRKEEQHDGDKDLKQQDLVAKAAAADIPVHSLLTSDEDSDNEEPDIEALFRRPRSAWHLFNTSIKGKGLSREEIVRLNMLLF